MIHFQSGKLHLMKSNFCSTYQLKRSKREERLMQSRLYLHRKQNHTPRFIHPKWWKCAIHIRKFCLFLQSIFILARFCNWCSSHMDPFQNRWMGKTAAASKKIKSFEWNWIYVQLSFALYLSLSKCNLLYRRRWGN